jgi:tight adherence protein C
VLMPLLVQVGARRRADEAAAGLPEALDLLVVCLDSGLSLEDSLARVVSELDLARAPLAEELALTLADLQILPSRDEALGKMAERLDLPSVRTFVATLIQTLRYGTPLSHALRTIAAELRNDAMIKLEEKTNKLPALLTVPLMLFIMPTIFLIIGGPAFLRLLDVWR